MAKLPRLNRVIRSNGYSYLEDDAGRLIAKINYAAEKQLINRLYPRKKQSYSIIVLAENGREIRVN